MGIRNEQIGKDRRLVNAPWKWIKKQFSKARRRAEKKDPENASKKNEYEGYVA